MLYPSIETLFTRDPVTHKLVVGDYKEEVFSLIKEWEWTEKIDGTNIRVEYHPVFTRDVVDQNDIGDDAIKWVMKIGGRTENAQLPMGIMDYIQSKLTVEKLHKTFGNKGIMIFGEGYGDKIQEGSGYLHPDDPIRQKFIVFDICVNYKYWLTREAVGGICKSLGLDLVPLMTEVCESEVYSIADPAAASDFVKKGFPSQIGDGTKDAEGLVGRTKIPLFDAKGRRIIVKLRTEDFIGTIGKKKGK